MVGIGVGARDTPLQVGTERFDCGYNKHSDYTPKVYDFIDPTVHYEGQTYAGKVVFITGASRGIGAETALQYARAGASVALAARFSETLEGVKSLILTDRPEANVLTLRIDVTNTREVERAISETVSRFGRLDIVVANAGKPGEWTRPLLEKDPNEWWSDLEVNIRGAFNTVYFSIPHLFKTSGYVIAVGTKGAQVRIPYTSDFSVSTYALGRLFEKIHLEYPEIKILTLHPGSILECNTKAGDRPTDSVALSAATVLYLTSGRPTGLLEGEYVSANWDLGELEEKWKFKVAEKDALVSS
ncbi:NAD-P-binding protein [Mycena metata]|uniref:NAD-P-binding protein n=1 Tax=Mycena metata TaxID=1033252 RepID=A0AAD7NNH4_9AGAR|nr:NAD-P-binding protein [Mycena metata]